MTSAYGFFGGVWNRQMQQQVAVMSIQQAGISLQQVGILQVESQVPMLMQIQQQFTVPQALVKCLGRFHSNCNSDNPQNYWASQPENHRNVFLPYIFLVSVLTFIVKGEKKMTGHS
jgi:predicted nucleotide-binding protein